MLGFWEAVASTGPYANNLHLTLSLVHLVITYASNLTFPRFL